MRIGGFQPLTLSDCPGLVAAVVFAQGCNFRCPFCHNGSLLASRAPSGKSIHASDILDALQTRRELLDAVVVSGGEPTLQDDIAEFTDRIKQRGLKVKLDTNGSRPAVLRQLLTHHLLDYVAMDIKAPFHKYTALTGIDASVESLRESIALLLDSDIPCAFRTTFVPSLLATEDMEEIRSYLPEQADYTIQPFVADNALDESLRSTARRAYAGEAPPPMKPGNGTHNLPHHIDLLSGE